MKIEGVIFDADGTLLDSMGIWKDLGERYLQERGMIPETGLSEILYPMTLPESCLYLEKEYGIHDSIEKINADLLTLLENFYLTEVKLKPGVRAFLGELKNQDIPMMIASTNDSRLLEKCFEVLGIASYFQHVISASSLNLSKASPEFYRFASKKLGASPEHIIVFEDALYSIRAAKSIGMQTVAIHDPSNSQDREDLENEADLIIQDFTEEKLFIWRGHRHENSIKYCGK